MKKVFLLSVLFFSLLAFSSADDFVTDNDIGIEQSIQSECINSEVDVIGVDLNFNNTIGVVGILGLRTVVCDVSLKEVLYYRPYGVVYNLILKEKAINNSSGGLSRIT